ncbi:MAG: hypothetical protein HUK06_09740, partial [Bacteroidaceae bacterium]|nr:hypothetical protein [Bacteroidaceae bacterium]
ANLLVNGNLVWKHADDVSATSDVEQGLYSSQGNLSDPTTEGTVAPQTNDTVSAGKVTENAETKQGKTQENAVGGGNLTNGEVENTIQQQVKAAEAETNTEPTQAQIEAGNYKKGHVTIGDFDITIENPKGSERKGVDADGKQWSVTMQNTYGYIRGAVGVDGDHIDVFLGDNMDEWNGRKIFVVDQTNTDGSFDEHKCMIGFNDEESALSAYLANYSSEWKQTHPNLRITGTNVEDFKKWIDSSRRKTKPFAEYSNVKTDESTQLVEARTEGYSIEKRTDTRNGNDIFAVKFEERVSRDEFNGQKAIAKRLGGYWSNFGKKGFLFKSEEAAQDFAETVMGRSVDEVEDEAPITINDVAAVNDKNAESEQTATRQEQIAVDKSAIEVTQDVFTAQRGDVKTEDKLSMPAGTKVDEKALMACLNMGVDASPRDFAIGMPPTRHRISIGVAGAIIKASDYLTLWKSLESNGYTLDEPLKKAIRSMKETYNNGVMSLNDMVKALDEAFVDTKEAKQEQTKQEQTKQEEEPKKKSKFVNDEDADRFEELRKRLHQKLYGQLNSGFDPETFAIGAEMAYLMLKKGARKMNEFAQSMVELMGDAVRPHIKSFYDGARHMMSEEIQREMSSHEEVDAFDALNFDKQGAKDIIATAEHIANERKSMEIATEAEQQIKDKRNEEKRNKEKQVAADTETVVNEAEASASEVESKLETATTEEDANDLGRQVDEQLERVNEQLAILGYYEAEEVGKDWNEAYGYMRNAERKAVKDATALAERLVKDLGLNLEEQTRPEKGKTKRKLAVANIAPAGGEIAIRLHLNDKKDLYIHVPLEPDANDNLHTAGYIMYRTENRNGNGSDSNNYAPFNATYDDLLARINHIAKRWLPQEDYVAMAQRIAEEAEQPVAKEKKKNASKKSSQPAMPTFFDDLFAELDNQPKTPKNNEKVQLQPRPGKAEREGGHEPRQNEPLGKGEQHENERPDGRGVDRRGAGNTEPDAERGGAVSNPVAEQPVAPATPKNTRNNHAERGVDYAPKGENARIEANIKAIETMQRLIESGEEATPEDMEVLRKFSGWGGLGKAFNEKEKDKWGYQAPNPINKRLRELMSPEQYDAANLSRNSAYYTPAEVIDTMWDIARTLGFKGGRVLEGSAGIGNIIGLMPQDMSERSDIQAVEIDEMTGNILKLLYPDAKVEVKGFEMTNVPNGSVDLAITNVPFVTDMHVIDKTGDKDLSTKFRNIHDFCIAKNVRKLREGGIGIFITSSGTLDSSQKLRNWLVNEGKSDVVGAFRMHKKTFGGAGVTSDIIVVRKRVNGMKSANAIDVSSIGVLRTTEYTDTRNGGRAKPKQLALDFNNYFIEHPEYMAGEMRFCFEEGDTYHPTSKALYPRSDKAQSLMLREWADELSKMNWEKEKPDVKTSDAVTYEDIGNATDEPVSEGSMFLNKKGELCIAQRGVAVPLAVNANKVKGHTKAECFNAYKSIKDALANVLEYQFNNDDDAGLQPLIKKLNSVYDAFVRTYGHLNKNTSISFLRNDMEYPSIAALESVSETGDKKGKRIVNYGKTDIFSRRVVEKESEPKPTTVKDGIIASVYLNGRVDVPYIAGQLGMSEADVRRQIVESGLGFENPTTTDMEVSYEYLSGNVREKLAQATANNADGRYDANVKALERVVPMDIPAHLIEFTLGSSWIEPKLYEDFVKERTALDNVRLHNVGGTWIMNEPYYFATEQNKAMGVRSEMINKLVYGHELIAAALQNRTIQVSKTEKKYDGSTETITDNEATQACANKIDEIRQDFKDWARSKMQEDTELAQKIERLYNEQFNNYVPKSIPDEFVPEHFGGAARVVNGRPFQLRPHQAKAAIRATTQPLMLAHEVGTGKTYTLITTAMEMRRLGTARKPMIVVQNATVGQFVASAKSLYPNAKILTLEDADKNKDGRKNFYAKIRYNDWDMIVVPQSVFERIPDSEERQAKFVEDKIEEKMMVLEQMREAAGNDTRDPSLRRAEKELEDLQNELNDIRNAQHEKVKDEKREAKTRHNAEVKALEMLDRAVDDVANFDDMGIDALLIDEAHEYKHLGFT